jgi:ATP-binding cassette subfamily B (MDR/TAP) protein 1
LLDYRPEIDIDSSDGQVIKTIQGRIELKDVHFRYPTRPTMCVLRDFNLCVEPGTHVALVGSSGCGKSTVIQLIERFYDPISGSVMVRSAEKGIIQTDSFAFRSTDPTSVT